MTAGRHRLQVTLLTATIVALSGLLGIAGQTGRAPLPPATAPLTQTIPVDPAITTGQFANGLRYYIRANKKPEDRAELRLVVNAGSVLEEDDQRGLAHFVEHMAFNGTKHFPKQDIVNFVESIGMRFGNDLNASTGFDETKYILQVPTDKPAVLDKAMLILEDWAHDVTFDPVEIDKERGVIMEEWRLGRGAAARMQDKQFPVLLAGSRYADRLPIGTPDIIQNFKHDRLTSFYKDWYRPDLMAVVAVGDFDPAAIQALVKTHFESIPAAASPRKRPAYAIPSHAGTSYTLASDAELRATSVSVYNIAPAPDQSTIGAYREQQIVDSLFTGMLNGRYSEIGQQPNAPFLFAGAQRGQLVRTAQGSILSAVVKEGGIEQGLEALFTEAARVAKFGFTQSEFDRQKAGMLRNFERAIAERENQQSVSLAEEYIRNFTTQEPIPGIAYEYELYKRFLPEITLAEVNALARNWSPDRNRVVVVSAPQKPGLVMPTEAKLAAVMSNAANSDIKAYADTAGTQPLLNASPRPGTIVSTATKAPFGITEWKLSNGATVVLKPTTFKQDEVMFRAFSPGGTSLASDQDYIAAATAAQVVSAGGLGTFSNIDLRKTLTGKAAGVGASIGDDYEELNGTASPKDLETMFQLIYLRFTQPRADPTIFKVLTDQLRVALANQAAQPEFAFGEALSGALWQNNLRARSLTVEDIDKMSLEKSMAFYKDRYADASDFTFVFVGSFDPATLRPFVEQYVAALPSTHRQETWKDVGMRHPVGVVEKRVLKGIEPKSQTSIVFTGPFQFDPMHRVTIRAMSMVLDGLLRETLREDLGGTYSVSVNPSASKIPLSQYTLSIAFGSAPNRTDDLVARVFQKIDELKALDPNSGVSNSNVESIKQILLREFETNSKDNGYLLREITSRYQFGEKLDDFFGLPNLYRQVTTESIRDAARTYFDTSNYVKVELFPEK